MRHSASIRLGTVHYFILFVESTAKEVRPLLNNVEWWRAHQEEMQVSQDKLHTMHTSTHGHPETVARDH